MADRFNLHGTGKDLGPFEIDWTDGNREKIEVCLLQGGMILESGVLTPVNPVLGIQPITIGGVTVSGQVELVLGEHVDKLIADLRWNGAQKGTFNGILAQFA